MNIFKNETNVLVIGDLHTPFNHKEYLKHCKDTYKKYKCNKVVLIGDLVDNHFSSFHETNPNGYGAGQELTKAVEQIKLYYKAFPEATVLVGNHDRIILRKAIAAGVSTNWIKDYADIFNTPNWTFQTHLILDNVLYHHGEGGGNLLNAVLHNRMNIVQGHYHTKFEIKYTASTKDILWGLQTGCGIDDSSYAFDYAKLNLKRSVLGCSVVLNNGTLPVLIPMNL